MTQTLEDRVESLEDSLRIRDQLERMYSEERMKLAEVFQDAIKIQANSLSIPILKDVLVPMGMRVFTFFALVVFLLLSGILGIKLVFGDILKAF